VQELFNRLEVQGQREAGCQTHDQALDTSHPATKSWGHRPAKGCIHQRRLPTLHRNIRGKEACRGI